MSWISFIRVSILNLPISLKNLFWVICNLLKLVCDMKFHTGHPYVSIGLISVVNNAFFLWRLGFKFLFSKGYNTISAAIAFWFIKLTCLVKVSLESRVITRYLIAFAHVIFLLWIVILILKSGYRLLKMIASVLSSFILIFHFSKNFLLLIAAFWSLNNYIDTNGMRK